MKESLSVILSPNFHNALSLGPALIELGLSDEALRYYAHLVPILHSFSYEIALENDSALLDSLRLKRNLVISLVMADGQRYQGRLSLDGAKSVVTIDDVLGECESKGDKIYPIT